MEQRRIRVAVIGAGPSGLTTSRHLAAAPDQFEFVCYEQCSSVGGAWFYAEDNEDYDKEDDEVINGNDENNDSERTQTPPLPHLQSCMYKNLRTNSPVEVFAFPDYPFTEEHFIHDVKNKAEHKLSSFITHQEMLLYLRSYAKHYDLMQFIRLNNSVQSVRRVNTDDLSQRPQYCVTALHTLTGERSAKMFDAVMVCNGHYTKEKWPKIKNLESFQGKLMHAKFYRHPKQFSAYKNIVVMGGGYSGVDIVLDLEFNSKTEKDLILSVHDVTNIGPKFTLDCKNVRLKPDIVEIIGTNEVKFADGTTEKNVDAILIGTGYYYDFPFLSHSDGLSLKVEDQRLMPLYKHIVHIDYPTVGFIGMVWTGLTFPQFELQAKYFLASLRGDIELPSKNEMLAWTERDFYKRTNELKWPQRYAHKLGQKVVREYNAGLCEESGIEPLNDFLYVIDRQVEDLRNNDPVKFKLKNYRWGKAEDAVDGKHLYTVL